MEPVESVLTKSRCTYFDSPHVCLFYDVEDPLLASAQNADIPGGSPKRHVEFVGRTIEPWDTRHNAVVGQMFGFLGVSQIKPENAATQ